MKYKAILLGYLPIILTALVLPSMVKADTIVSGSISSDITWSPAGGAYIINSNFSVDPGVTLTVQPGTIIRAQTTNINLPSVYGKIDARGTADSPIYFTSVDSVSHWPGLHFKNGSEGYFDHVFVTYAGGGNYVGIENDGGSLEIHNSNISQNYINISNGAGGTMKVGTGIHNIKGSLSVYDSTIDSNVNGIFSESGTTTLVRNYIINNFGQGIALNGEGLATVVDNSFSGNNKPAFVNSEKAFVHSGNTSVGDFTNRGFEIGGTARDGIILDSNDLPLILTGYLSIDAGVTVNVAPGTIIKIGDARGAGGFFIHGTFNVLGTKEKPIYFTSNKDDSVGGDSNGDGGASTPAPKNWNAIFFEAGSKGKFENAFIQYAGFNFNGEYLSGTAATVYNRGADLSFDHSFIGHNFGYGIFQDAGTTTIFHSEITDQNTGLYSRGGVANISQSSLHGNSQAIYNQNGTFIDARNNWWGDASGPHDNYIYPVASGTGDNIDGANILYIPFLFGLPKDPEPVEGSIEPVIIIPGIMGSARKNGQLIIDPILHTYDDLISTLDTNGYTPGVDLFTFPYEWRDSNVLSANLLKDKINQVKQVCGCNKVDLVAHSMGGLVAREYIQSGQYSHDVDQIIFLGTPHKGSQASYLRWEAGQFPSGRSNILTQLFFQAEALESGYSNIFNYVHNRPIASVQQLLPTFDYLKDKSTGILRTYPASYPRNTFLENLNNNISSLLNSGVRITNMIGNSGLTTINKIRVVPTSLSNFWQDGEPDGFSLLIGDNGLERGVGDETVTIAGATLDASIPNQEINAEHQRIPVVAEAQVFNILTRKIATTTFDHHYGVDVKMLVFQLFSPVDFVIVAPDGKRMGKNFIDGSEYNEIPGAFYSGYNTNEEYITIPNPLDGQYSIQLQGTGSGKYTVASSYISDIVSTTTDLVGTTSPNQINNVNVVINNNDPSSISIDPDLIADINKCFDLGWIKDIKVKNNLITKANNILKFQKKIDTITQTLPDGKKKQRQIERLEKRVDKIAARALLVDLKALNKAKITEQAYNIIKSDLDWIINN